MKHWQKIYGEYYLATDTYERILSVTIEKQIVQIREECDSCFLTKMSVSDFVEALREMADKLEE